MIIKKTEVCIAPTTIKTNLTGNLCFTVFGGKTPVLVLDISCTDNNIPGNLDKIPVITAMRADYPPDGLT
jgi:hypothetical protein